MKYLFKGLSCMSLILGMSTFVGALYFLAKYDWVLFFTSAGVWKDTTLENWMPYQFVLLAFGLGMIGVILNGLGVLGAKPRYLWISWLVVGTGYCVLTTSGIVYTTVMQLSEMNGIGDYLVSLAILVLISLPGIASIILSMTIKKPKATVLR